MATSILRKKSDKTLKEHLEDARKRLGGENDIVHKKFVDRILDSVESIKKKMDEGRLKGKLVSDTI